MPSIHSKQAPAIAPDDDDDGDNGQPLQLRVSAAGRPWPATSAPRSAFDAARANALQQEVFPIRKGVPLPPGRIDAGSGAYRRTAAAMQVGDSVVLPHHEAKNLMRIARKHGDGCEPRKHFCFRTLDAHSAGVWRDR